MQDLAYTPKMSVATNTIPYLISQVAQVSKDGRLVSIPTELNKVFTHFSLMHIWNSSNFQCFGVTLDMILDFSDSFLVSQVGFLSGFLAFSPPLLDYRKQKSYQHVRLSTDLLLHQNSRQLQWHSTKQNFSNGQISVRYWVVSFANKTNMMHYG